MEHIPTSLTLERRWRGLGHMDMLLIDQVDWLVLSNLHTGAHIAFPMKKECEGTRQMLTGDGGDKRGRNLLTLENL